MSDNGKVYKPALGFIQFDPKHDNKNGKAIRQIALRSVGSTQMVYVTVWDQHEGVPLKKGDAILAEGEYRQNTSGERTYHNISARLLINLGNGAGVSAGISNASASSDDSGDGDEPF